MTQNAKAVIWKLKPKMDRRFRGGHPWVYSNELAGSPKGVELGAWVELRDAKDQFLARGFGNPHSLISFRAVSRDETLIEPGSLQNLKQSLLRAHQLRELAGMSRLSHRLIFGEADRLPGLVIDRYFLQSGHQVFVIQAHTAGADRLISSVLEVLPELTEVWEKTAVVLRNDVGVRKLEGLEFQKVNVLREVSGLNLGEVEILVKPVMAPFDRPVVFSTDLLEGQKTGFFLDQYSNIQLAALRLGNLKPKSQKSKLKILDLCCYVGQWGAQLARVFRAQGIEVEVTAVDSSEKALQFAQKNIEREGARCQTLQVDVLRGLAELPTAGFDLVICDPPALIKSKKDTGPGAHAYLQLNTQAARLVRPGGGWVSCSCSSLLTDEEFAHALTKAASRNSMDVRWLGRGTPSADHPQLTEFPEGRYLKCWIGGVI